MLRLGCPLAGGARHLRLLFALPKRDGPQGDFLPSEASPRFIRGRQRLLNSSKGWRHSAQYIVALHAVEPNALRISVRAEPQ
jgi:hypothetical protein